MRMDVAVKDDVADHQVKPSDLLRARYAVVVGLSNWDATDEKDDDEHAKAFADAHGSITKALADASSASSGVAVHDPLVAFVAPGKNASNAPAWAAAARQAGASVWCDSTGAWTRALGLETPNGGRRYAAVFEDAVLLRLGLHASEGPLANGASVDDVLTLIKRQC